MRGCIKPLIYLTWQKRFKLTNYTNGAGNSKLPAFLLGEPENCTVGYCPAEVFIQEMYFPDKSVG